MSGGKHYTNCDICVCDCIIYILHVLTAYINDNKTADAEIIGIAIKFSANIGLYKNLICFYTELKKPGKKK